MSVTFEAVSLIAAHQGLYDALVAAGVAHVQIRSSSDVLLADLPLSVGVVDGAGQLTFAWGSGQVGLADGTASYVEVRDYADVLYMTLTAVESLTPVADSAAMTTLQVLTGAPVSGITFTIG